MLICHHSNGHGDVIMPVATMKNNSNENWWCQQCTLLLFWELLTLITPVTIITVVTGQISLVAIVEIIYITIVLICNSDYCWFIVMIISLMSAFSHHSGITAATVEKSCVTIAFFCSSEKKGEELPLGWKRKWWCFTNKSRFLDPVWIHRNNF
jgi:hypothetical protein